MRTTYHDSIGQYRNASIATFTNRSTIIHCNFEDNVMISFLWCCELESSCIIIITGVCGDVEICGVFIFVPLFECVLVLSDTVSVTFENTTYVTIWETQIVLPPLSPPLRPQTPRTIRSTPKYHEHRLPCTCLWDVSDPCPCLRYPWRWNEPDCNDWVWRDPHFSGRSLEISLCSSSTPWLEICVCVCVCVLRRELRLKVEKISGSVF